MAYASYAEAKNRKPFRWWYDAIIDWRLANPGRPEYECAHAFGVSANYLSLIVNSDMFKARWEQRRRDHSEQLGASVQQKLLGTLDASLDLIQEHLRSKRTAIPFQQLTDFSNKTLERLGYGAPKGPGVVINNTQSAAPAVVVSAVDLAEARALLRRSGEAQALGVPSIPMVDITPPPPLAPVSPSAPAEGKAEVSPEDLA